jgi:hypothetical protein
MGYFNPYIDKFTTHLSLNMPFFDNTCYERYPNYRFLYDKLWIIKSQGLNGGRLEKLEGKEDKVNYPIFIKPRWGHLSASSKNCFKISTADELKKYIHYKNMMWSDFIDAKEIMTDYILLNGKIVHQITYVYSEKQNEFSDDWKFISPASTPAPNVTEWIKTHIKDHTGVINVQCRDNKIIEAGLRLARGGAYLVSTENAALIENVNRIFDSQTWHYNLTDEMKFKPFYVYKCYTKIPIIYIFPQKLMDWFITKHTDRPFYEYYFEPTGSSGMIFYQFMDNDFEKGMQTKLQLEKIFDIAQILMYVLLALMIFLLAFTNWSYKYFFAFAVLCIFLMRIFNPIATNYSLYKAQKQSIFGGGPTNDPDENIETFDNPH